MTIRQVLLFGDAGLRVKCAFVDLSDDAWRRDADDLLDTLDDRRQRLGFGRALAAPQIGSSFRLIAFDCALGRFVAVNPEITWCSDERHTLWDDCFSLPGTCMAVRRHCSVSFKYLDDTGQSRIFERLDRSLSELIQHEVDHLDGVLMVDRLLAPAAIVAREWVATHRIPPSDG